MSMSSTDTPETLNYRHVTRTTMAGAFCVGKSCVYAYMCVCIGLFGYLVSPSRARPFSRVGVATPAFPGQIRRRRMGLKPAQLQRVTGTASGRGFLCASVYVVLFPSVYPGFFPFQRPPWSPRCWSPANKPNYINAEWRKALTLFLSGAKLHL